MTEHDDNPEPPTVPRVIDRLRAARLAEVGIQEYFLAVGIRLDGQQATDLDQPAPTPARPVIDPS